jgi:uncharacterized membrane protein
MSDQSGGPSSGQAEPRGGEQPNLTKAFASQNANMVMIIYILYLVGFATGGLTGLIGLIMAYVNRKDAAEWLRSHYDFQIRTFWIGLLYVVVGALLAMVFVGWLVLLWYLVWTIVRVVKGMKYLSEQRAVPQPETWGFG